MSDNANAVMDSDDEGSEYALVTHDQVFDNTDTSSYDDGVNDIIDWKGRLMLKEQDNGIIDYTDSEDETSDLPLVRIEPKSWRKRRYWKDAEIDSVYDDTDDDSSVSDGSNRYQALFCWCIDDDDDVSSVNVIDNDSEGVPEHDNGSDQDTEVGDIGMIMTQLGMIEEATVPTEIAKHQEADNLMSYQEQVESERQVYDVHEAFYDDGIERG